ncbi:uncharacterized protein VTP21DRAFT_4360 [Calcarisporiella thermophila]|uniref:uncharacterized protein n=1 Tax=Calcarisporiella thermophila TaxID=911321 RepID=UPI00374229D1
MSYHRFQVFNHDFIVRKEYCPLRELGKGAYGVVCAAENVERGQRVAIKKLIHLFDRQIFTKRALREIKLLQHFSGHKNIINLIDMEIIDYKRYNEIYLYTNLMDADLHAIIRSGQSLTEAHYQTFIHQILAGLKYIHSANVLHRDLKPGNIFVNANCELRIGDFGLARNCVDKPDDEDSGFMTEYVATRWYRAPEIMLSFRSYTKAIDIWSVGCIFAELLGGRTLFKGRDYVDQLNQILGVLGKPDDETIARVGSNRVRNYLKGLPNTQKVPFARIYPKADLKAIDLLDSLLAFDPSKRITVQQALEHPYLAPFHFEEDEPSHHEIFDFSFEATNDMNEMKEMIANEVRKFRNQRNSLRLDVTGVRRENPISPSDSQDHPTPASATSYTDPVDGKFDAMEQEESIASAVVQTSAIPMDEDLERELSGISP